MAREPSMNPEGLRARIRRREALCGIFVKIPAYEVIEVLAGSGLDFLVIDGEHAPFDRARTDACVAMARALGLPCLVRVQAGTPERILAALDSGANGVVVPHCDSVEKAEAMARAAHYGHGGRGFAGSTRFTALTGLPIAEGLAKDDETVVLVQIEEPEGVAAAAGIAAVANVDGLFVGPADLAVCYGETDVAHPKVRAAIGAVDKATRAAGKATVTFAPGHAMTDDLRALGVSMFVYTSDLALLLAGARALSTEFRDRTGG